MEERGRGMRWDGVCGCSLGEGALLGREGANGEKGFPASGEEASLQERRGDGGRGACEGGGPLGQELLPFGGALGEEGVSLPAKEGSALERWKGTGGLKRSLRAGVPGRGWGALRGELAEEGNDTTPEGSAGARKRFWRR